MTNKIIQIEGITSTELIAQIETVVKELLIKNDSEKETVQDELLTRKEVSKILNVSLMTLNRWDKQNILKPSRIGRRVRYLKSNVMASLNKENE